MNPKKLIRISWIGALHLAVLSLLLAGCAGSGNWQQVISCKKSHWFHTIKNEAWTLVPGSHNQEIEDKECYTGGGYFNIKLNSNYPPSEIEQAFQKSATRQGWTYRWDMNSMWKCVDNIHTDMNLITDERPDSLYYIQVESMPGGCEES